MKKITFLLIFTSFISSAQWTQLGNSINGQAAGDAFGYSTAISANGNIIAVGANSSDSNGNGSGQVRVFGYSNNVWSQIGGDINGETGGDQTGQSVSLSNDGSIVAIGEPFNNDLGFTSGQVRVFRNVNNAWIQVGQDLYGENSSAEGGKSVHLSADGSVVAFGIPNTTVNGVFFAGRVKVFENQNNNWVQKGADIDGDGSIIKFGTSVSISDDGNILAIGQTGNPGSQAQTDIGRVKVYQFINNQWLQLGSTIPGSAVNDEFGSSVSLSDSGTILAIGSFSSNQVKIYQLINGNWTQLGNTLVGENPGDLFGGRVSLSNNGNFLAVGARFNSIDGFNKGRAYIYENQGGTWTLIDNPISGANNSDLSAFALAISQDGSKVIIGSTGNDDAGSNAGHIRVFQNTTLSTSDFENSTISFYPNPAKDIVNFSASDTIEIISLYNLLGQEVLSKEINSNEFKLDISSQPSGTYIAKINSNGKSESVKLIKL
ncbi:T9SS type A sorting domain-containing protein [Flavobacterium sp. LMO8]|uniref:T9SS type A sorting domain-containing protein n=1 Tax=Flavobacterium sp. LMO8 TaxID=2654244 RepID=UPI001292A866|nr:T9SS type A sorting domain-containing protein [Flavobacterium sp. LMO8]MQP25783.1 T9SS type A sorting domain-containing protein [Flavobacterium sp. LMO8]